MKYLWIFLVAGSVALAGCVDEHDDSVTPQPQGPGWSFDEDEAQKTASLECDETLEPTWFRPTRSPWYHPKHFGFSPNGGLLRRTDAMLGNTQAHRTSDGEPFFDLGSYTQHAIDASWTLEARSQAYTRNVDVVDRRSHEVVATIDLERDQAVAIGAAFGPQSDTVGLLACRQDTTSVIVWSLADDREVLRADLDPRASCQAWTRTAPRFRYTPDGKGLVVLVRETGHLTHVDLGSGQMRTIVAHQPHESDEPWMATQGGLDLAVHPSGSLVATSGAEGEVRLWKLPSLEPTGTVFEAGVAVVNVYTYATPHRVSPIAWSPDGELLATMADEGRVVLREPSGEVVSTLVAPQVDSNMPEETTPDVANPPMEIVFDQDGRIGVGAYASVGLWTCGQPESARVDEPIEATIHLDGPQTLQAGEVGIFQARIDDAQTPVVTRLIIDEEVYGGSRASRRWSWRASEPGLHRARLEVDDGRSLAIVEMNVEVTE